MDNKRNWIFYTTLFLIGILAIVGCKKNQPEIQNDEVSTPAEQAVVKETPAESIPEEMGNSESDIIPEKDVTSPQSGRKGVQWMTDYEMARSKAVREGKELLINFSGSDWCGWCIKLEEEVFSQDAFAEEAEKYFVFMLVDFPYDESVQSAEIRAQNEKLARIYGFRGMFPTIYLASSDGRPYAMAEYKEGGPAAYLNYLLQIRKYKDR